MRGSVCAVRTRASQHSPWPCLPRSTAPLSRAQLGDCDPAGSPRDGTIPTFAANALFTAGGAYSVPCAGVTWNLTTAQAAGVDVGSTVAPLPADDAVLALVAAALAAADVAFHAAL